MSECDKYKRQKKKQKMVRPEARRSFFHRCVKLKGLRWFVKIDMLIMSVISASHVPFQYELAIYHSCCGRNRY